MVRSTVASRQNAGRNLERITANYFRDILDNPNIDRQVKRAKDQGDISGITDSIGRRITIECKSHLNITLPKFFDQAQKAAINNNSTLPIVIYKAIGYGKASDQIASTSFKVFINLITPLITYNQILDYTFNNEKNSNNTIFLETSTKPIPICFWDKSLSPNQCNTHNNNTSYIGALKYIENKYKTNGIAIHKRRDSLHLDNFWTTMRVNVLATILKGDIQ